MPRFAGVRSQPILEVEAPPPSEPEAPPAVGTDADAQAVFEFDEPDQQPLGAPPPSPPPPAAEEEDEEEEEEEEATDDETHELAAQGAFKVEKLKVGEGKTTLNKVTMPDRRQSDAPVTEWLLQHEVESLLYGRWPVYDPWHQCTGAVYRLLQRTEGAADRSLKLTGIMSVNARLITANEWDELIACLHSGARRLTLIPLDVVASAAVVFGRTPASDALLRALGRPVPHEWRSSSEDEGEEEDEPKGRAGSDEDEDEGDAGAGGFPEDEDEEGEDDDDEEEDEEEDEEDDEAENHDDQEEEDEAEEYETCSPLPSTNKRSRSSPVSAALEANLQCYERYRLAEINQHRSMGACRPITVANDKSSVRRFVSWVESVKGIEVHSLYRVFANPSLGEVVQAYVRHLITTQGRRYSTAASYLSGLVSVTRYVLAVCRHKSVTVDASQLDRVVALHKQCLQKARAQAKFAGSTATKLNWLDWADVQRARVAATQAYASEREGGFGDEARLLARARDALVLTLLTHQPPDRVGVMRCLQLGVTLKRTDDPPGYELDLTQPDLHKTSSVFGPTRTTVSTVIAQWMDLYLHLCDKQEGIGTASTTARPYLFHQARRRDQPLSPSQWTRLVKACFKRHSGVPLAPKDLRASFVTFLKSHHHGDATLRAAALAMRHSSKTQASDAYNKDRNDRLVSAAVIAAEAYASKFQ